MSGVESSGDLGQDGEGRAGRWLTLPEAGREIRPVDMTHGQEEGALDLARLVERDDVGMVDGGGDPRLTLEAGPEVGVAGQLVRQQLEGHVAPELALLGKVHDAHATATEHPLDAIRAEISAQAGVRTRRCHGAMKRAVSAHHR